MRFQLGLIIMVLGVVAPNLLGQSRPSRPGACCITTTSGSLICILVTRPDCAALNGQFGGGLTSCTDANVCPNAPVGACCVPYGSQGASRPGGVTCTVLNEVQCANRGGVYRGAGVSCRTANCQPPPPPVGACCINGACSTLTRNDCNRARGIFQGNNSTCATTPCPGAPRGACCVQIQGGRPGGPVSCILTDAVTCSLQGGTYQGDGSTCRAANCPPVPPPVGACCNGGICTIQTIQDCRASGGLYRGDRTSCTSAPCPGAPTGACCISPPGGQQIPCIVTDAVTCALRGGVYRGDNSTCRTTSCISPSVGACCTRLAGGGYACVEVLPAVCTALGGTFSGLGIPCSTVPCPPPCPCDINGDGVVDAADEAAFQLLFAAGNADYDMDGDTDLDDWALFYSCYPQGCP